MVRWLSHVIVTLGVKMYSQSIRLQRKANRATDKHDWPMIFDLIEDTLNDLRENFPYAVIKIDSAEADDIIGALTVHKSHLLLVRM